MYEYIYIFTYSYILCRHLLCRYICGWFFKQIQEWLIQTMKSGDFSMNNGCQTMSDDDFTVKKYHCFSSIKSIVVVVDFDM